MLTGKELGAAIKQAVELKDAASRKAHGPGVKLVDVASHFGVKPPSVQDWINKGTIAKDKLPALWLYFSDVVGPEHWGLASFPQGRVPGVVFNEMTDDERRLLENFRILTDPEQQHYAEEIAQRAELLRAYLGKQMHRLQAVKQEAKRPIDKGLPSRSTDEQKPPAEQYGLDTLASSGKQHDRSQHRDPAQQKPRRRS